MTDAPRATKYSQRSISGRLRIGAYLLRLDWHLEGSLPSTERKATIQSLQQEITADPRHLTDVLNDLGAPQVLATRYADEGTLRPQWSIGIIVAGLALLVYWALFLSYAGGMLAAVDSAAPGTAESFFLFIQVNAFSTAEGVGIGWDSGWAWLVVPAAIIAVAYFAGARAWRVLRRTR